MTDLSRFAAFDSTTRPRYPSSWSTDSNSRDMEVVRADHSSSVECLAFLVLEGFSMMSLTCAIEPLRSLNRLSGRTSYQWLIVTLEGEVATASNGMEVATRPFAEIPGHAGALFVCGGLRVEPEHERPYIAALRRARRLGIPLGALSTGAYLLARAGLLTGYRCTIHWENRTIFREEFPTLDCTDKLYEIDRDRLTCSGGTASMDMMLHLIASRHGRQLAQAVANQFHHDRIRDAADEQRGGWSGNLESLPEALRRVIRTMVANIETPLPVEALADVAGVSTRQLERIFMRHLRKTPARYYLELRIAHGRELLIYSNWQILDVAVAAGFTSTSQFSQWFRRLYGISPTEQRLHARLGT